MKVRQKVAPPSGAIKAEKFILPREHGAWPLFLVPMGTGLFLVPTGVGAGWETAAFVVGSLALFFARQPVLLLFRAERKVVGPERRRAAFWLILYLCIGAALLLPPIILYRRYLLFGLAGAAGIITVIHLYRNRRGTDRSLSGQLLGVAGLTLSAPAAHYFVTGRADIFAVKLWVLNALFFVIGLLYVRAKIWASGRKGAKLIGAWPPCLYSLILLVGLAVASKYALVPWAVVIAYLPMAVQVGVGTVFLRRELRIKNLGRLQLAHSVVFGAILVLSLRRWG